MKWMLLIYENADTREKFMNTEEGRVLMGRLNELLDELRERGEFVIGEPLADPSHTITVRDGIVTDAPLVETKEHFGGYMTIDVDSKERAIEIAKRFPGGPFELRPLMEPGAPDM